jgi:hypothetical protein
LCICFAWNLGRMLCTWFTATVGSWWSQWVAMAAHHCYSWWRWKIWQFVYDPHKGMSYDHSNSCVAFKMLLWRFLHSHRYIVFAHDNLCVSAIYIFLLSMTLISSRQRWVALDVVLWQQWSCASWACKELDLFCLAYCAIWSFVIYRSVSWEAKNPVFLVIPNEKKPLLW